MNLDAALEYVRQSERKTDYIVITHLNTQSDPWTVELRLLRTDNGKCISNLETSFVSSDPGQRVKELSEGLAKSLTKQSSTRRTASTLYKSAGCSLSS